LKGVFLVHNKSSTRIALGGISAALCLVVMMTTALMPFATYALPALAGILLIPIAFELGCNTAWITYIAVAILSILIVPDKEAALMFISFFGYYPILKIYIDKLKNNGIYIHSNAQPLGEFDPAYKPFIKRFEDKGIKFLRIGCSGHAHPKDLIKIIDLIKPKLLIPIHSYRPEKLYNNYGNVLLPEKKQTI
jgi:hypothetical protein